MLNLFFAFLVKLDNVYEYCVKKSKLFGFIYLFTFTCSVIAFAILGIVGAIYCMATYPGQSILTVMLTMIAIGCWISVSDKAASLKKHTDDRGPQ